MTVRMMLVNSAVLRLLFTALALVGPGAIGLAVAACDGTPGTSGMIEIKMGAATRTFVVRLPAKYDGRTPAPLVFAFHPFGMNAQYMQGRVPIPREWPEALAVYPQGLPRGDRGFQPGWQTKPGELEDRDLVFFDTMLDWLRENHCFDPARVSVIGYSNGANLTSVLACERADAIAGFAIASGALACPPPTPKPVMISHGMRDPTIRYERAIEAAQEWTRKNECSAAPKSGAAGCSVADSCSAAPVVFCSYDGGHEYHEPFTRAAVDFLKRARLK
jgi:polyhydroxybutyrate depolymerase